MTQYEEDFVHRSELTREKNYNIKANRRIAGLTKCFRIAVAGGVLAAAGAFYGGYRLGQSQAEPVCQPPAPGITFKP
jgi:hypothetical protein